MSLSMLSRAIALNEMAQPSTKLDLNFVQAALGDTVHVPTVHEMSIWSFLKEPKPVRNSASVEKGSKLTWWCYGDQYVSVNVVTQLV